jgi:hypothetical protein
MAPLLSPSQFAILFSAFCGFEGNAFLAPSVHVVRTWRRPSRAQLQPGANNGQNMNVKARCASEMEMMYNRRDVLGGVLGTASTAATIITCLIPLEAQAKVQTSQTSQYAQKSSPARQTIKPQQAFQNLLKAREELETATSFLAKKDLDGMRSFLQNDVEFISNFQADSTSILVSKMLR